jgi:hypothetical protein
MRQLWEALAMLARDENFTEKVRNRSEIEMRDELPDNLREQPTLKALEDLNDLFAEHDLYMSAYELAEINRWVRDPDSMDALHEFWKTLTSSINPDDLKKPKILETIGALAIDSYLRFRASYEYQQKSSGKPVPDPILQKHGFNLEPYEKEILSNLEPGGKLDIMLAIYQRYSWPGPACTSRPTAYPGWEHTNV